MNFIKKHPYIFGILTWIVLFIIWTVLLVTKALPEVVLLILATPLAIVAFLFIMAILNPHLDFPKMKDEVPEVPEAVKVEPSSINKSYIVEFPFYGMIGEEYIDGKEIYKRFTDVEKDYIISSWNTINMHTYIDDESIKNKILNMTLTISSNGVCNVQINTSSELNRDELNYVLNFIKGQCSDGWGEGNFDFGEYSVAFWKNDSSWYIKYKG